MEISDIIKMVKLCHRLGATRVKIAGEFEVDFSQQGSYRQLDPPNEVTTNNQPAQARDGIASIIPQSVSEDIMLSQRMIDDPLAYEQEMIDGGGAWQKKAER